MNGIHARIWFRDHHQINEDIIKSFKGYCIRNLNSGIEARCSLSCAGAGNLSSLQIDAEDTADDYADNNTGNQG
ncbi:hypothetical protein OROMI_004161 [Orobanche minor]